MPFELEPYHRNVPDEALLSDLQRVAHTLTTGTVSWAQYEQFGSYGPETVRRRFGAWNTALERAGLRVRKRHGISDAELFENLADVWTRLGRQPRREDVEHPPSRFSASTYERRFRTWRQALAAFVAFANSDDRHSGAANGSSAGGSTRSAPRQPSLRLRFKVMRRDRFCCRHCGASPAKSAEIELHVDHVVSWSEGGETTLENLQTLCSRCNLGKSDLSEA